jgi:transcriptional regulator with XRE-family HTH domain
LLRVENANAPDLETYFKICNWLNVPTDYFSENAEIKENPQKEVIALLRADKKLPRETANMLADMINLAYGYLEGKQNQKQAEKT